MQCIYVGKKYMFVTEEGVVDYFFLLRPSIILTKPFEHKLSWQGFELFSY